jgi:hypothetical protein
MTITDFNPNRLSIRVGHRQFLLDLNLAADGTGIARLSVVDAEGKATLISSAFRRVPEQKWEFMGAWGIPGSGDTPREAALDLFSRWMP